MSSLLLGVYEGEELVYTGRAGTGFTARTQKDLAEEFKSLKKKEPPFKQVPVSGKNATITWLEPVLVAENQVCGMDRGSFAETGKL